MAPRGHLGHHDTMTTISRPSFLDAYLVAAHSMGASPVGVVRKERNVWRIMRFGVPADQQPREAFATREEAGTRLMELAGA
jgi:hypothetical protein